MLLNMTRMCNKHDHYITEETISPAQQILIEKQWDTNRSDSSALGVYIPKVSTRPIGMSLTSTAWVKLNRLCTSVGRFVSSMNK